MKIQGTYPVSPDFGEQERLIQSLTTQIVIEFSVVLEIEQEEIRDTCAVADIDFEFVIDSSGFRLKIIFCNLLSIVKLEVINSLFQ